MYIMNMFTETIGSFTNVLNNLDTLMFGDNWVHVNQSWMSIAATSIKPLYSSERGK